jgi:hypothetical protein
MHRSNATAAPSTSATASDYTQIFFPAINSYNKLTGQDLKTHCAASDLVDPAAVYNMLQVRMQGFDEFRNRDGNMILMTCLQSTVDFLFTIETKLGIGESADSEIVSDKAFFSYRVLLEYLFLSYPHPRKQSASLSLFSLA